MTWTSWLLGLKNKRNYDSRPAISIGKMPGLRGDKKRRINSSALEWLEPSGPSLISSVPPASVSASVSDFGDTHTIVDSLGNKPVRVTLVGADTDRNYNAYVYMGATKGWGYNLRNYRRSKLLRNTMTLQCGDCMTTATDADINTPTYITTKVYTDLSDYVDRNYDNGSTSVTKCHASPYAALQITGKYSNLATHFCFPVGIGNSYGSNSTGERLLPYGIDDLFATYSGFTGSEYQVLQQSVLMSSDAGSSNVPLIGPMAAGIDAMRDDGIYASYDTIFTIHNPEDTSIELDVYYVTPRKDTVHSPVYDYISCYTKSNETIVSNNGTNWPFICNRSLWRDKGFRDRWKMISCKRLKLCGNNTVKFKCRIPLSLIKYNTYKQASMGQSNFSLAGLTGWFYVVSRGVYGLDTVAAATNATTGLVNNKLVGYGIPSYCLSMEQKVTVLGQSKNHRIYMDQRYLVLESDTGNTIQENDENAKVND